MNALLIALLVAAPPDVIPPGEQPLVDVRELDPRWVFDLRYATEDNFFGQKAYPVAACFLRKNVAAKMVAAQRWIDVKHPGHVLMFKDCYRPDRVQWILWAAVKDTPKRAYVANPNKKLGSIHSYGAAVDVTLADADGKELDLGTPYDFLGAEAEPRHEAKLRAAGKLTDEQLARRRILREAMRRAGLRSIPNEWWHFNAPLAGASRLDVPFESLVGP